MILASVEQLPYFAPVLEIEDEKIGDYKNSGKDSASIEESSYYNIYPNPANNAISITTNNEQVNAVALFNLTGKQIFNINFNDTVNLDVSDLSAGIYIAVFKNSDNKTIYSQKLIKQ